MSTNNGKTDTHIYNIINNPPKEFTEPCECCGVSEFQLGVRHAEERIIKLLEEQRTAYKGIMYSARSMSEIDTFYHWEHRIKTLESYIELIKGANKLSDPLEEGYKHLANDPEFARPNRDKHHCGFDFIPTEVTAECKCGRVAMNPPWTIEGQKKNQELLANPWYPSPYFTVIDEFDSNVFKVTATEWEKLNAELDKD